MSNSDITTISYINKRKRDTPPSQNDKKTKSQILRENNKLLNKRMKEAQNLNYQQSILLTNQVEAHIIEVSTLQFNLELENMARIQLQQEHKKVQEELQDINRECESQFALTLPELFALIKKRQIQIHHVL